MTEYDARHLATDRARNFIASAKLAEFGVPAKSIAMAEDILTDMQMRMWHEGAFNALDKALEETQR